MKRVLITTFVVALVLSAAITNITRAATDPGQALEIAPPMLSLSGNPGETIETKINIRDVSVSPLVVSSAVNDFGADGENGIPKISLNTSDPNPYSLITWVKPIGKLTLQPKQIDALPVSIAIPANAAPGGYYGVIRFTAAAPQSNTTSVTLSASLGTLVFVRVNGTAKESASLEEFSTTQNGNKMFLFEATPVDFTIRVKNDGNVYEQPVGQIAVTDMFGNPVGNVNVNLDRRVVLPGSIRKLDASLDKGVLGNRMLFGRYTAKLTMTYGANGQKVTTELSFFVIPWKLILLGLAVLVGGFFLVRFALRRYTERILARSPRRRR